MTDYRWIIRDPMPLETLEALSEYPPVLSQLLWNRGVRNPVEAELFLKKTGSLYDPFRMDGMKEAVAVILEAVDNNRSIRVYGDYDVDGVTASAILLEVLGALGAKNAKSYIPDRFDEGYGLNTEAIRKLKEDGTELIITVDCGIRSPEEAKLARELGMKIIISDHHQPGDEIPEADYVICPKKPGDRYPEKNLAGVGISFKIAEALLLAREVKGAEAKDWIDLAAIGTIADMVPLTGENRCIARAGLLRLRTFPRPAIRALAEVGGFRISEINADTIGFSIAPRLNAAGRLDKADIALQLMMSRTVREAKLYAEKVDTLNKQRQDMTKIIQEWAVDHVNEKDLPYVILCRDADFGLPEDEAQKLAGVVGLASSKIIEKFYRPAIVGTMLGEHTRASCRSIEEFNIINALDECSDLTVHHGGHAMAAGLTVRNEDWEALDRKLNEIGRREMEGKELRPTITADMELPGSCIHQVLCDWMKMIEPHGSEVPSPLFCFTDLFVKDKKRVGTMGAHLKMTLLTEDNTTIDSIGFGLGAKADSLTDYIDVIGYPEINEWNNVKTLQIKIKDIRESKNSSKMKG